MSAHLATPNTETAILARLLQAKADMSPEVAEFLVSIDFSREDIARMNVLGEAARLGSLTPEENAELDRYLHIGNLLTIVQSAARLRLQAAEVLPLRQ